MSDVVLKSPELGVAQASGLVDARSAPTYRLLAVMVAVVCWLALAFGFGVGGQDVPLMIGLLAFLIGAALVLRARGVGRLGTAIEGCALILASSMAVCCLSVVLAAPAPPLRDAWFDRIDALMSPGFGWLDMYELLRREDALVRAMSTIYATLHWQPFLLVTVLALAGREGQVWRLLHAWFLALILCVAVFGLVPAVGPYPFHQLSPADIPGLSTPVGWDSQVVLDAARSGRIRSFDPANLTGLIAFPSFHAAAGTLLAWGAWRVPLLRLPCLALNLAMIATTPLIGSHYFCDVVAGIGVALLAIAAVRKDPAHPA